MAKLIWGIDPLAVSRLGRTAKKPPFTKKELARIGIPAHKIPRVQEELARLTADKTLTREELGGGNQLAFAVSLPSPSGEGGRGPARGRMRAKSPPLLHKLAASARFALISQRAGPLTASPSGEAFFRKLPLFPPATYAIISVSCQIHPARWEKRFVWQPAMRKE